MKNTLAENMLRFGAKNLDAKSINRLQILAEQVALTSTAKNVTLMNDVLIKAANEATLLGDPDLLNGKAIVFPPSGTPAVGDWAVTPKQGYIVGLTGQKYLVLGNIGKLAGKEPAYSVTDAKPMAMVLSMNPYNPTTGVNNAGTPAKGNPVTAGPSVSLSNIPYAIAQVVKAIIPGGDKSSGWDGQIKLNLISIFKFASEYGNFNTSVMDQTDFDQLVRNAIAAA